MAASNKILVCGDVRGEFSALFDRVAVLESKAGPFAAVLCVGTFFSAEGHAQLAPYISGAKLVAVPTYFVCGDEPEGSTSLVDGATGTLGVDVAPNISYLGRHGVRELSCGITVGYLR